MSQTNTRLWFWVRYNGEPFFGWQSQKSHPTVQDTLQGWLSRLYDQPVILIGASRTDRGVHARAQLASADVPDRRYPPHILKNKLNQVLSPHIHIDRIWPVPKDALIQQAVASKVYHYVLCHHERLKPFRGAHFVNSMQGDPTRLNRYLSYFEGTHDFQHFANAGSPVKSTVRTIFSARARALGPKTFVRFHGSGFLKQMVRNMIGATLNLIEQNGSPEDIQALLTADTRHRLIVPAPPHALILMNTHLHQLSEV